jgi:hypothetical protein
VQFNVGAEVSIVGNEISKCTYPLDLEARNADRIGVTINNNRFYDCNWVSLRDNLQPFWSKGMFVNAENNYWSHPSGPRDDSDADGLHNPYPRGQGIVVHDGIDYVPFIGGSPPSPKNEISINVSSDPPAPLPPNTKVILSVSANYQLRSAASGQIVVYVYDADGVMLNQPGVSGNVTRQNQKVTFPPIQTTVPELSNAITIEANLIPDGGGETVSSVDRLIVNAPPRDFRVTGVKDAESGVTPKPIRGDMLKLQVDYQYTYTAGNAIVDIEVSERLAGFGNVLNTYPIVSSVVPPGTSKTGSSTVEVNIPMRDALTGPKTFLQLQVTMKTESGSEIGKSGMSWPIEQGGRVMIDLLAPGRVGGTELWPLGRSYFEVGELPGYALRFDYEIKTKNVSDWLVWVAWDEALDASGNVLYRYTPLAPAVSNASTGLHKSIDWVVGGQTPLPAGTRKLRVYVQLKTPNNILVAQTFRDIEVRDQAVRTVERAVPAGGAQQVAFAPMPVTLNFSWSYYDGFVTASEYAGQFRAASGLIGQGRLAKAMDWYWEFIPINRYWAVYDTMKERSYSATVSFTYDPAIDFPADRGFTEDSLVVAGLNTMSDALEVLPSTLDKGSHTITTNYDKFFQTYVVASKSTKTITEVQQDNEISLPEHFSLGQNYPNPFNPETVIEYQLPHPSEVEIDIFNLHGQKVATLVREYQSAGSHKTIWNGRDESNQPVASGLYLYQLKADKSVTVRKMLVLR